MLVQALGGAAAIGLGTLAYAVRAPRSSLLAPGVYCGSPDRSAIALTFDDGPSESTPALLELLAEHDARATFFHCGVNVTRLRGQAREVAAAGHEIGNHTQTHAMLSLKSPGFIFRELDQAQKTIEGATGVRPRLFRPPYGVRWFGLRAAQERLGLTGVMWSVIGLDWKLPPGEVAARLARRVRPGSIVCLHDGRETAIRPDISGTLDALRRVIPQWKDQGFQFQTVTQLLCPTN
jgi:peptidoglycan/xylan/chitin deacetylase (PgdA/CDA1 family)